jgi:hypothetical protein
MFPLTFVSGSFTLQYKVKGGMNDLGNLNKALGDISSIRRQMAQSTEFRGYGPATLVTTGVLAVAAAGVQQICVSDPASHIARYLTIWIVTAVLSSALIGAEMYARTQRIHSGMADEMIRMAVEQFLPAAAVGGLVTVVMVRAVPGSIWMLPGLWQVIFSLGVFSSCRFLPRPMMLAGSWYLLTGLSTIAIGDNRALAPWTMGVAYGVGQTIVAAVLFFRKREDGDES